MVTAWQDINVMYMIGKTFMILIRFTSFALNVISRATWFVLCWNTQPFAMLSHIESASLLDETDNRLKCSQCGRTRGELVPGWQPTYPPLAKQMGEGKRLAVQKSLRPLTYTLHFCYNTRIFKIYSQKDTPKSFRVGECWDILCEFKVSPGLLIVE